VRDADALADDFGEGGDEDEDDEDINPAAESGSRSLETSPIPSAARIDGELSEPEDGLNFALIELCRLYV